MLGFIHDWRQRRTEARYRAAAAEFHQAAGNLPFSAFCELVVAHAEDRRDAYDEPMRDASRCLDRMADRLTKDEHEIIRREGVA